MNRIIRWSLCAVLLLSVAVATAIAWLVTSVNDKLDPPADLQGQASITRHVTAVKAPIKKLTADGLPTDFSWTSIVSPPKSARPWTRWWWPGGAVDLQTLSDQVKLLDGAHFGGAEIQASAMGIAAVESEAALDAVYSFDTPAFYKTLSGLMHTVSATGWQLDLTHLSGWPPGGPQVNLDDSLTELVYGETLVRGGRKVDIDLPKPRPTANKYTLASMELFSGEFVNFPAEQARIISVLATRRIAGKHAYYPLNLDDTEVLDPDSSQVLTQFVDGDRLTWQAPEGEWRIIASYLMPSGEVPINGAQSPQGFVIDHLRTAQVRGHYEYAFGARTGLPRFYGKSLRGFFNDSLEFRLSRMSVEDILSEFKARRGYDLETWLPAVYLDGADDLYFTEVFGIHAAPEFKLTDMDDRIRYDYSRTLSDLMIERFVEISAAWAEARGLTSRGQSYGMDIDILRALGANTIPETEQLWDGGSNRVLKMASSAAALYGKPFASAESFVWRGYDYSTTARKIKAAADKLLLAGINHIVYHGTPYPWQGGEHGPFGKEGWSPFSGAGNPGHFSSIVGPQNTQLWPDMKALNQYITRSQYLLRQGAASVDVLVYYPFLGYRGADHEGEALLNGAMPDYDAQALAQDPLAQLRLMVKKFVKVPRHEEDPRSLWIRQLAPVLQAFDRRGITWAWVNAHAIESGLLSRGRLTASGGNYSAILLPNVAAMDKSTLVTLSKLLQTGDPIYFFGSTPTRQPGFNNAADEDATVRSHVSHLLERGARQVEGNVDELLGAVRFHVNSPVQIPEAKGIRLYNRVIGAGEWIYFFANQSPTPETVSLDLMPTDDAWWFDALEGKAWLASIKAGQLELTLGGFSSRFLVLGVPIPPNLLPQPASEFMTSHSDKQWPLTAWTLTEGDIEMELTALSDWRELPELTWSKGPGVYAHNINLEPTPDVAAYVLDLGLVHGSALVTVNGARACRASVPPFTCDISELLQSGKNRIEVAVLPPMVNGFIKKGLTGDPAYPHMQRGEDSAFAAGLIGPVRLARTTVAGTAE